MKFEEIYKKYYKKVVNTIRQRINDEMTAEELATDVMMKVHKNLDKFDENLSKLNTWIHFIVKNTLIDYYRKKKLQVVSLDNVYGDSENEETHIDHILAVKDTELNPEERMIDQEVSRTMYDNFNSLKEDEKIIASLHYFDGLSYDEIVDQLNMPLGTVKAKLHKARVVMMNAVPVEMRKLTTI
jgi:RNA polymerase sigma-70 factor (ECF subfamily)